MNFEFDIEQLANAMAKHGNQALEERIKVLMREQSEKFIEDAAKQMVEGIKTNITGYKDYMEDKIVIHLNINKKEIK